MVNKLGTFKLAMIDEYTSNRSWPATINGATAPETVTNSFFKNAVNFRYNFADNKAWWGYQLSSDYGSGWIFFVLIANADDTFAVHCGSLNNSCTLGSCDSIALYPTACSEVNLDANYGLE